MGENQIHIAEMQEFGERTRERLVTDLARAALDTRRMYGAGIIQAPIGFSFAETIGDWLILACYAGTGEVLVDGEWRRCTNGSVYVAPPGAFHGYRALEEQPWGVCWSMYHQPGELDRLELRSPVIIEHDVRSYLMAMMGLYTESIGLRDDAALVHWVELLHLQGMRILDHVPDRDRLYDLWQHVDADLSHPWTLGELAKLACLCPEQLRVQTQKSHGRSPMKHLTALRMRRAAVLLQSTGDTVAAIGAGVGYTDPYAFSEAFKRWMGAPPSAYRDQRTRAGHRRIYT